MSQRSLCGLDDSSVTEVIVWSFDPQDDHQSYVTEASELKVRWSGFQDPHSGLTYFRVALGSAPALDDVVPFLHVGLQTCEWTHSPPPPSPSPVQSSPPEVHMQLPGQCRLWSLLADAVSCVECPVMLFCGPGTSCRF